MNKITIELCAEDRERIDRLTTALEARLSQVDELQNLRYVEACEQATAPAETPEKAAEAKPLTDTHPIEESLPWGTSEAEAPQEKAPEPVQPKAPAVKRADVQQKVIALVNTGKKAEAREIVKGYANSVTDIPEDKLAEVLEKLNALEG